MLLAVDVGNTNITLALFDNKKYVNEFRLPSDKDLSGKEYEVLLQSLFKDYSIDDCIIGSVVEELTYKLKHSLDCVFGIDSKIISCDMNLGISICIDNPKELGADRIANAVAVAKTSKTAVIVVDFGTATTFDIINSKKEFIGGIIAPGLTTQLKSLKISTSKLPKVDVSISANPIGKNTSDAIVSGVVRGSACMVEGMLSQCEKQLGEKALVIATGGYCGLISNYMTRRFDRVNQLLTLEGLRDIYYMNFCSDVRNEQKSFMEF